MSNVIPFLEAMGRNPGMTRLSAADFAATVALLEIGDAERQSLLLRDHSSLNDLLGGRAKMVCMVWSPEEQPVRKDDDQPDEEQPVTPPESE